MRKKVQNKKEKYTARTQNVLQRFVRPHVRCRYAKAIFTVTDLKENTTPRRIINKKEESKKLHTKQNTRLPSTIIHINQTLFQIILCNFSKHNLRRLGINNYFHTTYAHPIHLCIF